MQRLDKYNTPDGFRGKSKFFVQLWWLIQGSVFKYSPQFMYTWRAFVLKCFGADMGKNVIVRPTASITYPWKVKIGDNSWVGDDVILYSLGEIEIGKNTVISQRSYLCTGSHDYLKDEFPIYSKKIIIGNGCWLATDVYVAPGVIIEDETVVGARSSVFGNLPPNKICVGSPARPIKERYL